jgi:lipopolysaccharide export system protein LptC
MKFTSKKSGVRLIFLLLSLLVLAAGAWEMNCKRQMEESASKVAQNDDITTCGFWDIEK